MAVKLTVRLPEEVHQELQRRAQEHHRSLNYTLVEALRRQLRLLRRETPSEYERVMAVVHETGLVTTLGPQWDKYLEGVPIVTHEELWNMTAGLSPLSEDIIADRGER